MTGNTVVDALFMELSRQKEPDIGASIENLAVQQRSDWTGPCGLTSSSPAIVGRILAMGFEQICRAIHTLALRYPKYRFIYPVHLNPNVQEPVQAFAQ